MCSVQIASRELLKMYNGNYFSLLNEFSNKFCRRADFDNAAKI